MNDFSSIQIVSITTQYIRFHTSKVMEGTDAMHTNCDYSAIYLTLITKDIKFPSHSLPLANSIIFTIGKGSSTIITCVDELKELVIGMSFQQIIDDFAGFWRKLTCDPQMRWIGP